MSENFQDYTQETEAFEGAGKIPPAPFEGFTPFFSPEELEKMNLKKQIKKAACAAGLGSCFLTVFSFLIGIVLTIFFIAFFGEKGLTALEEPAITQVVQIVFSIFSFTAVFAVIYKLFGFRISSLISFKRTEKGLFLPLLCMGLAFCGFANIGASYIDVIFSNFGIDFSIPDYEFPKGIFGFFLSVISTAVVPALVEEFAMRGLLLGSLRKFGDGFALITSSVVFGLMHGNFEQIPFAFIVGLFLGFSVLKTNSLRIAIIVHFLNNLLSVIFSYINLSDELLNLIYLVIILSYLVLGMLFLKKSGEEDIFKIENGGAVLSEKEKYKAFFTAIPMIIFAVICVIEAVALIFI